MVRASRAAARIWRDGLSLVLKHIFVAYLCRGWRWQLALLAVGTGFALDWLEELHGNLLHAVDKLDRVLENPNANGE